VRWDSARDRVVASRRTRLDAIVVRDVPLRDPPSEAIASALLAEVARRGAAQFPWNDAATRLRARLEFARHTDPSWPDVGDATLFGSLDEWLRPAVANARSMDDIAAADVASALLKRLTWQQRAELDRIAPTHCEVPTGSRMTIDYSDPYAPSIAVRLQELYGLASTPTVAGGRVPLTLHLLSPAHRPVQVTRDLAAFWGGSYAAVRKEMKGRYPRHDWPEDPASASPSRGRPRRRD
jgi:ATP-dependent helicase HrpB